MSCDYKELQRLCSLYISAIALTSLFAVLPADKNNTQTEVLIGLATVIGLLALVFIVMVSYNKCKRSKAWSGLQVSTSHFFGQRNSCGCLNNSRARCGLASFNKRVMSGFRVKEVSLLFFPHQWKKNCSKKLLFTDFLYIDFNPKKAQAKALYLAALYWWHKCPQHIICTQVHVLVHVLESLNFEYLPVQKSHTSEMHLKKRAHPCLSCLHFCWLE